MDFTAVTEQLYLSIAVAVAFAGWVLSFLGIIIIAANLDGRGTIENRLHWFYNFYFISLLLFVAYAIISRNVRQYRLALVAFLSVAFNILVDSIDVWVRVSQTPSSLAGGAGLRATGCFLIIFPVIFMIGYIGMTTEDSARDRQNSFVASPAYNNSAANAAPAGNFRLPSLSLGNKKQPATDPSANTTTANTTTASSFALPSLGRLGSGLGSPTAASPAAPTQQAKALYAYDANPEDPTEISFIKGEVMTVLETKGKWWKVSKTLPDGSAIEGIAPSNYLQVL
ncbi:hypothetical protein BC831DRAFT_443716, partial [Entophlyctis helioformis]